MALQCAMAEPVYTVRTELGGSLPASRGECLLSLCHVSDAHVIDAASPARAEWIELLGDDPKWKPLLHMHRPYEMLTHWVLHAHVQRLHRDPAAPLSGRPYDLLISTGDNIDNAQRNELDTFLTLLSGGATHLPAHGGAQDPQAWPSQELGGGPWPFWCPEPDVPCAWKNMGYPAVQGLVSRASESLHSPGLPFPWTSVPGNHDVMRQGTAWSNAALEAIATGSAKTLRQPDGFDPRDPLTLFVDRPELFSMGRTRSITPDPARGMVDMRAWLAAHVLHGARGFTQGHVDAGRADAVIDTEHVRILLLDTNHPAGDYQGSVGAAQLAWLEEQLIDVERESGRLALLASHHGSPSLVNTRGDDPERRHAQALEAVLHRHPCVLAWLVGHRHVHHVIAHPSPRGVGGFWEIATASLIDWPAQTRAIELMRHADGTVEIVCTLQDHGAEEGSLAHLHAQLAHRFAGPAAHAMQGTARDGSVRLVRP